MSLALRRWVSAVLMVRMDLTDLADLMAKPEPRGLDPRRLHPRELKLRHP